MARNRKPLQKATVTETACERQTQAAPDINKTILDKIQKCLNRAYHQNASEAEAKTALFIAQKLMSEHNVVQADLLENSGENNKAQYGGRSIVVIKKVAGKSQRVEREAFVDRLGSAICTFFDCRRFSTDYGVSMQWTFYGIAENTVAAALAFEMAHNLILEWACAYRCGAPTSSYRLGVAEGLVSMANREKRKELENARREIKDSTVDEKDDQSPTGNQTMHPLIKNEETPELGNEDGGLLGFNDPRSNANDDDDDDVKSDVSSVGLPADFKMEDAPVINLCDDVDEAIDNYLKQEPIESSGMPELLQNLVSSQDAKLEVRSSPSPSPPAPKPQTSLWKTEMQLVQFRANSEQVAQDYLEQQKIKFISRKGRKRQYNFRDPDSYAQGKRDSSKINVRQKALE